MTVTPPTVVLPLSGANGGTGLTVAAIGDLIYASATTPVWARLAAVALGAVLVSGGIGVAPAWSATPTLGGLTLTGALAMGANAITSTGTVNAGTFAGVTSISVGASAASHVLHALGGTLDQNGGGPSLAYGLNINPTLSRTAGGGSEMAVVIIQGAINNPMDSSTTRAGQLVVVGSAITNTGGSTGTVTNAATVVINGPMSGATGQNDALWVTSGISRFAGAVVVAIAANTTPVTVSGYSLTGSSALSMLSLAGTLNTSGVPTVIDINITQTASGAGTLLMQIRDGATNYLSLSTAGLLTIVALSLTQSAATAPSTNLATVVNRYGGNTNFLGDPTEWITVTTVNGSRKVPAYA